MAGFPENYKNHNLFSNTQEELAKQLESLNIGRDIPSESDLEKIDTSLLAIAVTNGLLEKHSVILQSLLSLLPATTGAEFFNSDGSGKDTADIAIAQLSVQQQQANFIHRYLEKVKLGQKLASENKAVKLNLIHEVPETMGDVTEVRESILKTMSDFSADDLSPDLIEEKLELFLERFILTISTGNLSAKASQNLLFRKLSGTALVLLKDYMLVQNPVSEEEKLKIMIHFLETRFLKSAQPILAMAKLRQIEKGNLSYAQLQAKISKLAKYSTLDEAPEKKMDLTQTRGLEQFKIAISEVDRNLLYEENSQRNKANIQPLTLIGAAIFLENFYQDKNVYSTITKGDEKDDSLAHINKIPFRPPIGQNSKHDKRDRPRKGNFQTKYNVGGKKKQVTTESLGLQKYSGILCGKRNHPYYKCFLYPNEKPFPSLCYKCKLGAHSNKNCKQNVSTPSPQNKQGNQFFTNTKN